MSMKECKDIPSNKRYVEGSIAESYLLRESVRYAMDEYRESLQSRKGKGIAKTEVEIQTDFIDWLYTKLLKNGDTKHDLWFFARGPLNAITTFTSSRKDKNPIDASAMWYGVIKQILEVNYNNFKEVVFYWT
ncbi:hypothetical protein OROHE_008173 [Orobanche hederae]